MTKKIIPQPKYEGGDQALIQFIVENMQYPLVAIDNKIQGTVGIKYVINHDGKVSDCKIIKSLGYGCDEEAIRLVKLLRYEIASKNKGLKVIYHKDIFIGFKLKIEIVPSTALENTEININNE
jgi:TonB family protein